MSIDPIKLHSIKEKRLLPGPALLNVYSLQGRLTAQTGLHIGSGTSPGADDPIAQKVTGSQGEARNIQRVMLEAPQAGQSGGADAADPSRTPKGLPLPGCFPYIPATSLRGVLRSWISGMLAQYGPTVAAFGGQGGIETRGLEEAGRASGEAKAPEDPADPDVIDEKRAAYLQKNLDLVAGLFGSTHWRSKVEFDPARIDRKKVSSNDPGALLYRVPRVAIDPHLGAAEDGKLFETELVRPGTSFLFTLRAQNVQRWELGLLLLALDSFNHKSFPTRLGGHTRQGYGELKFDLEWVEQLGTDPKTTLLDDWISSQQSANNGVRVTEIGAFKRQCVDELARVWADVCPATAAV